MTSTLDSLSFVEVAEVCFVAVESHRRRAALSRKAPSLPVGPLVGHACRIPPVVCFLSAGGTLVEFGPRLALRARGEDA